MQEKNDFTEKDYLEAQYKIQRSIQANVATIAFIVVAQFLITIVSLIILYSSLSSLTSIFVKKWKSNGVFNTPFFMCSYLIYCATLLVFPF